MKKNEFKIVIIGPGGVGKTNIIDRLTTNCFDKNSQPTKGGGYHSKSFGLEGQLFTANIWDTAGAEHHRSLIKIFLKDIDGVVAVYDITKKSTFDIIDKWIKLSKEVENSDIPMVIIGNCCDLQDKREVTVEEGELKAMKYRADFIETSALSGENIQKAFEILLKKMAKIGMEDYKSKYDKLKEDFDVLMQNYDKLKEDNEKLSNELNKNKYSIFNFEDKLKLNLNEINNLKKIILQKDDEINILNLKLKNLEAFSKKTFNNNDIISVHFISPDNNINCPIKCLKNDTFAEVEERLYQKYQEYRESNNKFISKGKSVMRFKKIIENNINDGDKIELINLD